MVLWEKVECPFCDAKIGSPCTNTTTQRDGVFQQHGAPHIERVELALDEVSDDYDLAFYVGPGSGCAFIRCFNVLRDSL